MTIELTIPQMSEIDAIVFQKSLETLAKNISKSNIQFLADISRKADINKKLESKKTLIKTAL